MLQEVGAQVSTDTRRRLTSKTSFPLTKLVQVRQVLGPGLHTAGHQVPEGQRRPVPHGHLGNELTHCLQSAWGVGNALCTFLPHDGGQVRKDGQLPTEQTSD